MKSTLALRVVFVLLLGLMLTGGVLGASPDAARIGGFCCPAVKFVRLAPVDPAMNGKISGYAEITECLGMSFLHIVIRADQTAFPNGTTLVPVFRGLNPLVGDWITITNGRGETVWQNMTLQQVAGQTLYIDDANFTDVLSGRF